ncbi:MAG TPA: ABC transporter permease [bacterium]|nr:ABC transporter permease [bacterium]
MNAVSWIESVGAGALGRWRELHQLLGFASAVFRRLLSPSSYRPLTVEIAVTQIYFTAVQLLGFFIVVSVVFGSLFIGMTLFVIKEIGLTGYIGDFIAGVVVLEMAPIMTTLLIALRSGSAINAEMAVMKANRELDALEAFGVDIANYLFLPRIVAVMVSVVLLSALFAIIVTASGLVFSAIIFDMSFNTYTELIAKAIEYRYFTIMVVKSAAFGFFITFIPLYYGSRAGYQLTAVPVAVLRGMVNVFIAIIIIEVLSLVARFL